MLCSSVTNCFLIVRYLCAVDTKEKPASLSRIQIDDYEEQEQLDSLKQDTTGITKKISEFTKVSAKIKLKSRGIPTTNTPTEIEQKSQNDQTLILHPLKNPEEAGDINALGDLKNPQEIDANIQQEMLTSQLGSESQSTAGQSSSNSQKALSTPDQIEKYTPSLYRRVLIVIGYLLTISCLLFAFITIYFSSAHAEKNQSWPWGFWYVLSLVYELFLVPIFVVIPLHTVNLQCYLKHRKNPKKYQQMKEQYSKEGRKLQCMTRYYNELAFLVGEDIKSLIGLEDKLSLDPKFYETILAPEAPFEVIDQHSNPPKLRDEDLNLSTPESAANSHNLVENQLRLHNERKTNPDIALGLKKKSMQMAGPFNPNQKKLRRKSKAQQLPQAKMKTLDV